MRSPNSLTLKPRLGITLIAASHDSLNPQLSVCFFGPTPRIQLRFSKHLADASVDPLQKISPEIHFNYLVIDTSVRELDLLQVSDRPGKVLKTLFGNFAMSQTLPFFKMYPGKCL